MVYKVSKGGVRSGNTLRGLGSHRNGRYTREACIVGRTNIKVSEVPTFLDTYIEDKLIASNLVLTDVALSLNKKKRWLLPATVGHMIKTGSFSKAKPMVSLLERHKLKRRANCVSFVCNQGRIRYLAPRKKKYFGFNLDNINNTRNTQSKRQNKRQTAKTLKQGNVPAVKNTKDINNDFVKTVEVFTVSGSGKASDVRKMLVSSKPEYRLEVVYPCPNTCSLTYNPKYTNVHLDFGEDGGMEFKSEKRVLRKGGRRRNKFMLKDLEIYDPEIVSRDTEELWDNDPEECNASSAAETKTSYKEIESGAKIEALYSLEKNELCDFDEDVNYVQENTNIIAILVAQAEKARSLCDNSKTRRKRKQSSKSLDNQSLALNSLAKSNIVYTNEVNRTLEPNKERSTSASATTTKNMTLHSTKVILKSSDVTPGNLRAKFGRLYAEAESEPRRFMIDVTEDIQNLLCPYRNTEPSAVYTSFLVFIHDGVYDEGLNTYRVIFNSNCCTETEAIKNCFPFEETTFEEIMNRVASLVLDMKEENKLDFNTDQFCGSASIPLMKWTNHPLEVNVSTFTSCDEIRRMSQRHNVQTQVDFLMNLDSVIQTLDFEIFCDICYENINPAQALGVYGTKLSKCNHIFCGECWRTHIRGKLKDGSVKMTCPGYECDQKVGPVTLLSLIHVSEVSKLFQRMCEQAVESSSNSKLCPNRDCGRVIKLDIIKLTSNVSFDVTCPCGNEFCFSCLTHPHWPATCKQAEQYTEKLLTLKAELNSNDKPNSDEASSALSSSLPPDSEKEEVMEYEGRICPKCSNFIEKYGGCKHMSCKCGYVFCWECLNQWEGGHTLCFPKDLFVQAFTLKVKVRHLVMPEQFSLYPEAKTKPRRRGSRQKTRFYKKAFQQRQEFHSFNYQKEILEMVKKIIRVSQENLLFKKEMMSLCGVKITDTIDLTYIQIAPYVTKFLRSCCEIKRALHHVAEFTFVLLQDAPDSVEKRRTLRLANDLSDYCIFIKSILETCQKQNMLTAVKRLVDIQMLAKRALTVLLSSADKLKR